MFSEKVTNRDHRNWLEFVKKAAELPLGYTVDDLLWFQKIAELQYPALAPLVLACIHLVRESNIGASSDRERSRVKNVTKLEKTPEPLLDLFRDRRLFPTNRDLSTFALRVAPDMHAYRFDKMSRGDIALRLVQYLEQLSPNIRTRLETSMREAISEHPVKNGERKSFVSKWESIIKDLRI